jgi:hypothetical protein
MLKLNLMKNLTFVLILLLTSVLNITINKSAIVLKQDDLEVEEHFQRIEKNLAKLENEHHDEAKELNKSLQKEEEKLEELHRKSEQALYDEYRKEEAANEGCTEMVEMHLDKEDDFRKIHLQMEEELREENRDQVERLIENQQQDEKCRLEGTLDKLDSEYVISPELKDDFQGIKDELQAHLDEDNKYVECYYDNHDDEQSQDTIELIQDVKDDQDELVNEVLADVNDHSNTNIPADYNDNALPEQDINKRDGMLFQSDSTQSDSDQLVNNLINQLINDEECLRNELNHEEGAIKDFYRSSQTEEQNNNRSYEDSSNATFEIINDNNEQERRHKADHDLLNDKVQEYDQKIINFIASEHSNLINRLRDIRNVDDSDKNCIVIDTEDQLIDDEQLLHDGLVKMELNIEELHDDEENEDINDHETFENNASIEVIREHEAEEQRLEDLHYTEEEEMVTEHERIMEFLNNEHDSEFHVLERI